MSKTKQTTLDDLEELEIRKEKDAKPSKKVREVKGPYELPEGWRWVRLEEIAEIIMGQSPPSETYNTEGDGLPFYQGKADFGSISPAPRVFCTSPTKIAEVGDILISVRAPVGPVNIANHKCGIGRGLAAIRVKNSFNIYVFYWLKYFEDKWVRGGTTFEAITKNDLTNHKIPLPFKNDQPDLEEQKRIVAKIEELFAKIDRIKELRRQAREEAENLLKAALHHVFSKADEKGWRWVKLETIAKTTSGGTPSRSVKEYWENGTIPWVKSGELEDNVITETEEKITQLGLENSNCKLLPKGILLVAMYGATVGKTAILGIEATTNQAVCAIFPEENIERDFIKYYIMYVRPKLIERSRNLGGAQPNISQEVIKALKIPLPFKNNKPDLEEQKRIAAYLDKIAEKQRKLLELYEQTEKELEMMKQAILGKAFRGELN